MSGVGREGGGEVRAVAVAVAAAAVVEGEEGRVERCAVAAAVMEGEEERMSTRRDDVYQAPSWP